MYGQHHLLYQMREQIRLRHYSNRTERVYCRRVTPCGRSRLAEVEVAHANFAVCDCIFNSTQH